MKTARMAGQIADGELEGHACIIDELAGNEIKQINAIRNNNSRPRQPGIT